MHWWIDRAQPTEFDMTLECEADLWVEATVIAALVAASFLLADAQAWTHHVFSIHANGASAPFPNDLTEAQWDRLTYE